MAITASEWLEWAIAFGVYPPNVSQGSVSIVDTGTGLIGGPITTSGSISFAAIAPQSFWANATDSDAVPTVQPLSSVVNSALTAAYVFVGNASNVAAGVALTGDVAISDTGVTLVGTSGTFTPAFSTDGTNYTSVGYSLQEGVYYKIGSMVFYSYFITVNALTVGPATGNLILTGFPFAAPASGRFNTNVSAANLTFVGQISAFIDPSESYSYFSQTTSAENSALVTYEGLANNTSVVGSGFYIL